MADLPAIEKELRARIKGRVAIMGVGNIMRGDDGLGPAFIGLLKDKNVNAALFDCGTVPENYIFPILRSACDTLVVVDAADIGLAAGEPVVLGLEDISAVSFSTHNPSPRLFVDLLRTGNPDLNVCVVPVQPKQTTLGAPLSPEVEKGIAVLADIFVRALSV